MNSITFFIYGLVAIASLSGSDAQEIEAIIEQYNQAGEQQETALLEDILSPDFRVLFNDIVKDTTSAISRAGYLQLLSSKALGGEKRRVTLRSLNISGGTIATAEVMQMGMENTLFSYMSLVKLGGKWQLGQTMVYLK